MVCGNWLLQPSRKLRCSVHEIAAVTGHKTLAMVALHTASVQQKTLAEAAITRLETAVVNRWKPAS